MNNNKMPGLNVRAPWARFLLAGRKTVETRAYALPEKYIAKDLWLIETPGKHGNFKARVIGVVRFSGSKEYKSKDEFYNDTDLHLIDSDNREYAWRSEVKKFGWIVEQVQAVEQFAAPFPRGIVYAGPFEAFTERQK